MRGAQTEKEPEIIQQKKNPAIPRTQYRCCPNNNPKPRSTHPYFLQNPLSHIRPLSHTEHSAAKSPTALNPENHDSANEPFFVAFFQKNKVQPSPSLPL